MSARQGSGTGAGARDHCFVVWGHDSHKTPVHESTIHNELDDAQHKRDNDRDDQERTRRVSHQSLHRQANKAGQTNRGESAQQISHGPGLVARGFNAGQPTQATIKKTDGKRLASARGEH